MKYLVAVWWTEQTLNSASYTVEAASEAEARAMVEEEYSDGVLPLVADHTEPAGGVTCFEISEVTLAR